MDKYKETLLQKIRQIHALADAFEIDINNVFDSIAGTNTPPLPPAAVTPSNSEEDKPE